MAEQVRIETPSSPETAKDESIDLLLSGDDPGKQKDIEFIFESEETVKDSFSIELESPVEPK
jgi:hypothetical protein